LKRLQRHHVHLSVDIPTALAVGSRHGKPVILEVDTKAMLAAGHLFYLSQNGVWLIESVEPVFLRQVSAS
jgi:putative RNA 2'-phosphotransferase